MGFKEKALDELQRFNELEKSESEYDRLTADIIKRVLMKLPAEERAILDQFYINRSKGHIKRLCTYLRVEQSHLYRLKEKSLDNFCIHMYGRIDLFTNY